MPQKRQKSMVRRFFRRLAYYIVMAVFFVPSLFSKKMTAIPDEAGEAPGEASVQIPTPHEQVEFREPRSGLTLRGVFIPGNNANTQKCSVVFCHGLGGTKTQLVPQAEFVHSLGYDVLIFDMRGHGESEGDFTSLGYFERFDALAACTYMREKRGATAIVLFGFSMGAVTAALAAAEDRSVVGLIAESPYDSMENIVAYKAREHYHVPKWPLVTLSLWATEVRRNFDRHEVDLTAVLPLLAGKELLLVASTSDKTIPVEMTRRLRQYLSEGQEYWEVQGQEHGRIFTSERRSEYEQRIRALLSRCARTMPGGDRKIDAPRQRRND